MSTKFYIKDENGRYLSTDGRTKYTCLQGKALHYFLKTEDGKRRSFHVDIDENGDKIGIEAEPELVSEYEAEDRRTRYLRDVELECKITVVSANVSVSAHDEDEIQLLETVASDADVERDVQRSLDLQNLRIAFSHLTESEQGLIYALFLSSRPMTERQLSERTGVPQKTINCRKKVILEKLKKYL